MCYYIFITHFKKKLLNTLVNFSIMHSENRTFTISASIATFLTAIFIAIFFVVEVSTISIYIKWCLSNLWNLSHLKISNQLSFKNFLFDHHPIYKIRLAEHSSVHAINTKNILVTDFIEKKKNAALFPPLVTDTSTCNIVK